MQLNSSTRCVINSGRCGTAATASANHLPQVAMLSAVCAPSKKKVNLYDDYADDDDDDDDESALLLLLVVSCCRRTAGSSTI